MSVGSLDALLNGDRLLPRHLFGVFVVDRETCESAEQSSPAISRSENIRDAFQSSKGKIAFGGMIRLEVNSQSHGPRGYSPHTCENDGSSGLGHRCDRWQLSQPIMVGQSQLLSLMHL